MYINSVGCVISRRKSTQYCNINIAIRGIFYPELAIIIIFNTSGLFPGEVQEIMDRFMEKYNFKDYVTSVQVYGNTRIIEIDILVPKSFPYQTIAEIDAIRNEIDQEIGGNPTEKWVTISFTGTRKWMAKDYLLDEEEDE